MAKIKRPKKVRITEIEMDSGEFGRFENPVRSAEMGIRRLRRTKLKTKSKGREPAQ